MRLAPNWQMRGGLIELLSALSEQEITALLDTGEAVLFRNGSEDDAALVRSRGLLPA